MAFENADYQDGRESLAGDMMVGTIVSVNFEGTTKFGEATVRIPVVHGEESETPDESLPVALFFASAFPESFGTFDVGDQVLLSFMNGSRQAPIIEGKICDLDDILKVVPEYGEHYGKIKGIMSKKIGACIFFNESSQSINIRFTNGASYVMTKDTITQTCGTLTVNTSGGTTVNTGTLTATVKGRASVTAATADVLTSGPASLVSETKVFISAPTVSINGL